MIACGTGPACCLLMPALPETQAQTDNSSCQNDRERTFIMKPALTDDYGNILRMLISSRSCNFLLRKVYPEDEWGWGVGGCVGQKVDILYLWRYRVVDNLGAVTSSKIKSL